MSKERKKGREKRDIFRRKKGGWEFVSNIGASLKKHAALERRAGGGKKTTYVSKKKLGSG